MEPNDSWERDAVYVRMSKRRKAKLLAIAQNMPASATPSDAIERAIDLACAGNNSGSDIVLEKLACIQEVVDQILIERREDADKSSAGITSAMQNSKAVLDLLAAAAAKPDPDGWDDQ